MNPTRRQFLSFLTPLAVLPVVGPHMLLSERPKMVGWNGRSMGDWWFTQSYISAHSFGRIQVGWGYNSRREAERGARAAAAAQLWKGERADRTTIKCINDCHDIFTRLKPSGKAGAPSA